MQTNQSSEVYYFWQDTESNTWGVTVADSEADDFSVITEFTLPELSAITAPEDEGGNGEGAAWGDAVVSNDGERIFVNARNADKVVVIDTETRDVETILDVGDRPVHSFVYEDELWVHVDGDGGFNVIEQDTLEVSELIEANTVGTGHGKLLISEDLDSNTYVTNTQEPAVFPINLETREVDPPIEIAGGNPDIGTHDKGYDPATGLAFFQLTGSAGFSFIDVETNQVVLDQVPITGRITHTPDDEYILILDAGAEENDIGIWDTTLDTHTQPDFDAQVTIGGGVSVNGTEFYLDGSDWEAWIPQTVGDNVAVLNLSTNEVDYIDVGDLTVPEGTRHFSRIGEIDDDYFFTYSDEGGKRIDLDTYEVSDTIPLGGQISRMAVVDTDEPVIETFKFDWTGQIAEFGVEGEFSYDSNQSYEDGIIREEDLISFDISFLDPEGNLLQTYEDNHLTFSEFNFAFDTNTNEILQDGVYSEPDGLNVGEKTPVGDDQFTGLNLWSRPSLNPFGEVPPPHVHFDDWGDEFDLPLGFGSHEDVTFFTLITEELIDTGRVGDTYVDQLQDSLDSVGQKIKVTPVEPENPPEQSFEPLFGTTQEDIVEVTGTKQLIFTGDSNDLIDASLGGGDNRIYALSGDDTIILGSNDRAIAGDGADKFFVTNGGDNVLTGGAGIDQFWIAVAEIPDTANIITDFTSGEDVLGITGLGIGFEDLSITQQEDNTLIATNGSNLAILQGIGSDGLSADNFAFV
ncbi:MAG: hypothetical protein AAF316_08820 [Cyanobacteria bacterium P01_A01_bin.80]